MARAESLGYYDKDDETRVIIFYFLFFIFFYSEHIIYLHCLTLLTTRQNT